MIIKKRIGFYSSMPLENKQNWSGTMYKMYEQLLKHNYEVVWIPSVKLSEKQQKRYNFIEKTVQKLFNRGYNQHLNTYKGLIFARKLKKIIEQKNIDLLFAPTAVCELAFLKTKLPIVYFNDVNIAQLRNYYTFYSGYGLLSKIETDWLEKKALNNADIVSFASDWASDYAKDVYKIPKEKVHTIKFGSNWEEPESFNLDKNYDQEITFLFLAVNWERKGGEIALSTIEELKNQGYNVKLQVVGCVPPRSSEVMEVIPFLNKNNPEDAQKVKDFLYNAHFMFIPTRADCAMISSCEAASYAMPTISTNTGGVSAHIEHQKTGLLLPISAGAKEYATEIKKILDNPSLYKELCINARKKYEKELNWNTWGEKMNHLIQLCLEKK